MQGPMGDVGDEPCLTAKITQEDLSDRSVDALHGSTLVAHEMDVNVVIHGVIRVCTMAYVRMCNKPNLLEYLEVAVDR